MSVVIASVFAFYLLIAVMPLTVFVPLGPPLVLGVHPMFVRMGVELSDVAALAVVLVAWWWGAPPRALPARLQSLPWLLLSLGLLAVALAPLALVPRLAVYNACRWLLAIAVCWSLPRMTFSAERVAVVLMVTLGIHVLVGFGQIVHQGPLGIPGELALRRTQLGAAVLMSDDLRWLRPYGLTFHPNVLAGFLVVALLLGLPLLNRMSLRLLWWMEWLGLFLTFSRTAWLATLISMPVAVRWLYRSIPPLRGALQRTLLGALVVTLVAGWMSSAQLSSRLGPFAAGAEPPMPSIADDAAPAGQPVPALSPSSDASVSDRAEMIRLARRVIADDPFTGVGAGNFPLVMLSQRSSAPPQYVHNVPLLLAAELGVAGGLAWLALWVAGVWALFYGWHELSPWTVVALCAWFALAVIALLDSYPWALGSGRLLTVTVLGLITCFGRDQWGVTADTPLGARLI